MSKLNDRLSAAVAEFLDREKMSKSRLAKYLGLTTGSMIRRTNGVTRWTLDDYENLAEIGVSVPQVGGGES